MGASDSAAGTDLRRVRVWDLPTRLFHWTLVALILTSYVTARSGHIEWHFLSGYAILALLLFRVAWGFFGSQSARFSSFVRGPSAASVHLVEMARAPRASAPQEAGHNPAGGYMVVLLLGLLLFQTATGLVSNDGLMVEGPLAHLVGAATSDALSAAHAVGFDLIVIAVALHVLAVLCYAIVARQDLVRPMLTGWRRLPARIPAPQIAPTSRAVLLLVFAAGVVWGISRLG